MHAFVITSGLSDATRARVAPALAEITEEFKLDPATAWRCESRSGNILAAGVHHSEHAAAPRRYLARTDHQLVCFDGLPVHPEGRFDARDAARLAEHWEELPATLEGQFNAVRVDLEGERAEILMDPLGLVRLYVARRGNEVVAAGSVGMVASILGCREPDSLGVASMVALGWAVDDRTLLGEVTALAGGAVHSLDRDGLRSKVHFDPQLLAAGRSKPIPAAQFTASMAEMMGNAVGEVSPVRCALTAGRDTRVLLALLKGAHKEQGADFYTGGAPGSIDVEIGTELARHLGLEHRIDTASVAARDWGAAADHFSDQNDGLASFLQLVDYIELAQPPAELGITLWGVGGEIGRAGTGPINHVTPNLPVISSVPEVQRRLMAQKMERASGLLTEECQTLVRSYLDGFIANRRAEGWRTREVYETFYAFERVGCGGATGQRRAASTGDVFSPYCSRQFIEYSFSLSTAERYLEAPHYRLLKDLAPSLMDYRFEVPFHAQRPRAVGAMAVAELIRTVRAHRGAASAPTSASAAPEPPFLTQWVEGQLGRLRELSESVDPAVWRMVSRPRLLELLDGSPAQRRPHTEALLRVATVLWFLGRPPVDARAPA